MFYLRLSYRDMEEWLLISDKICQQLQLEAISDHTTLYRAYKRLCMTTFEQVKRALLDHLALQEEIIALARRMVCSPLRVIVEYDGGTN
jgi:hypothetical protein